MKKKRIALLSVLGVAGGLIYELESQDRRNKTENAATKSDDELSAAADRSRVSVQQEPTEERGSQTRASMGPDSRFDRRRRVDEGPNARAAAWF